MPRRLEAIQLAVFVGFFPPLLPVLVPERPEAIQLAVFVGFFLPLLAVLAAFGSGEWGAKGRESPEPR